MKKSSEHPFVEIFTDGACSGNPGVGGFGAILRTDQKEKELSGAEGMTTNNRMELMSVIRMTGARGVVAAVDSEAWLPRGLARQLIGRLERMGVACATPKPLCSLTEHDYKVTRRERETYNSPLISEFARYFGQPDIRLTLDEETRTITSAEVRRDAVCGCARHVAKKLIGNSADDTEERAGLFHHHFPCLASMLKLNDYNHDTLMHESGHLLQENLAEQLKPYKQTRYIKPG